MLTSHIAMAALSFMALSAWFAAAAVPEKLQKDIDKAKADYKGATESADGKLLSAFETEIEAVRASTGLKGAAKLEAIESLGSEKTAFEKHGFIPFSLRMRAGSVAYLKAMQQARRPLEAAYEKAIDELIKSKDDASAALVQTEKKKGAKSKVVGIWEITGVNSDYVSTRSLCLDGSIQEGTIVWKLDRDKLVMIADNVDTLTLDSDGRKGMGKSNKGAVFKGKRIDPPAK